MEARPTEVPLSSKARSTIPWFLIYTTSESPCFQIGRRGKRMGRLPFHHWFRFLALCAARHPWPLATLSFDPPPRPSHRSQLRCHSHSLAHVSEGRTGSFHALFRSIALCHLRIFHPRGHATWLVHVQVQPLPRRSPPLRFYFPIEPVRVSNRTRAFSR